MRNFVFELQAVQPDGTRVMRRVSELTRKVNRMIMPAALTKERIQNWVGQQTLIQDAFPDLTAEQREFILTGSTPEEWDAAFKEDDDINPENPDGQAF